MARRRRRRKLSLPGKLIIAFLVLFVLRQLYRPFETPWEGSQEPVDTCPYSFSEFLTEEGRMSYEDDAFTSRWGIDVSYAQGVIDWQKVKDSGVQFAVVRVGYRGYETGLLHEDDQYVNNMTGAYQAGIPTGVYFYTSAVSVEESIEEADFVLSRLRGYYIEGPVALDMEQYSANDRDLNLGRQERTLIAAAFLQRIRDAGYTPVIYASSSWFETEIYMEELQGICSFWVASYNAHSVPLNGQFTMWQYSPEGWIDGISVPVDMNILMIAK